MNKLIVKIAFLLFVFFNINMVQGQHDQAAKEILDKLAVKTNEYKNIKASFTNSLVNEVEDFRESFNGVIYTKGKKYKLEFMDTETYFDGETKWVYIIDANEVNISSVEEEIDNAENEILNDPTKIFSMYQEGFKYMLLDDRVVEGKSVNVVDLVPESLEKNYSRIRLFIDKEKSQLYSIKYFSKDGNNYIFTIDDFEVDLNLGDAFFNFKEEEHPGVEIIDLRE